MSYDSQNFPIWASAGPKESVDFIAAGWGCQIPNPNHFNWWMNRTDSAIEDHETRITQNTDSINLIDTTVNNLNFEVERSGLLGVYVYDSASQLSISRNNSPGISSEQVLKSVSHTVQAEGDVFVEVGFESNIVTVPSQGRNCVVHARLFANDTVALVGSYGTVRHTASSSNKTTFFGVQSAYRLLQGNYDWNTPGQTAPPAKYENGDVINLEFRAYLNSTHWGAAGFGWLKIIVREYRTMGV